MERIRVVLAEDEGLLRSTLSELLALQPDMDVVGEAADGEHLLRIVAAQRPDVVLADIEMPRMDGITATRMIREDHPEIVVVILTNFEDDDKLFGALKAGALGYVLKSAALPEVTEAVRAASRGEGVLPASLVPRVISEFTRQAAYLERHHEIASNLTRRETEILQLLGTGARNRDIADRLYLSERTVKNHVSSILAKLHVNSRTEAALIARQFGF